MEKEITLTFTAAELENLNYALNAAQLDDAVRALPRWNEELSALWLRIYRAQKSL